MRFFPRLLRRRREPSTPASRDLCVVCHRRYATTGSTTCSRHHASTGGSA